MTFRDIEYINILKPTLAPVKNKEDGWNRSENETSNEILHDNDKIPLQNARRW